MKKITSFVALIATLLGIAGLVRAQQQKGGGDITGPYDLVAGWPQNWCGNGFQIGSTAGVWAESPDRVMIFARGCLPALKDMGEPVPTRNASGYSLTSPPDRQPRWDHIVNFVDRNGKLIESWEQHNKLFVRPHRILVNPHDPQRHYWLVDDGAHAIYKFTRDGKQLLQTIGTPMTPGNDATHFNRPTDIAFMADGTFFVSDGYVNTRVVKFDRDGKYVMHWGMDGKAEGEMRPNYFDTVHAIVIDKQNRLYVSDREHSRIQIFDQNGKFLEAWPNVPRPYSLLMTDDQFLWSASGQTQKFTKYDLNGKLLSSWGTFGTMPGAFWGVHQFDVDSERNLYTADVHVGRPQKFRPRAGVDPALIIGQPLRGAR